MATQNLNAPDDTDEEEVKRNWTWLKVLGLVLGGMAIMALITFFVMWQHIGPTPGQCGGPGTPCAAATPSTPPTPPTPVPVAPVVAPPAIACSVCESAALAGVPTADQGPLVLAEARSACAEAGCR